MTSRTLARRPLQLGGLLLTAAALGLTTAPAALADDPATPPQTDPGAGAGTPEVLTPDPSTTTTGTAPTDTSGASSPSVDTSGTTTTSDGSSSAAIDQTGTAPQVAATTPPGARFGTGKQSIAVTADALPGGGALPLTGARLELRFSEVNGAPSTTSGVCEIPAPTPTPNPFIPACVFDSSSTVPLGGLGQPDLPPNSVFTLSLVRPPSSGPLLVTPAPLQGYTTADNTGLVGPTPSLTLAVQHSFRTLGVSVVDGAPAGTQVALCPAVAGVCAPGSTPATALTDAAGQATFLGGYLPGEYLVTRAGTATPFTVPAATTTTERDTPLRLTLGAPVTPPTPAPTPAPGTATSTRVAAGGQQTVTLSGFLPGETVRGTLHSTPVDLGTAVADAQGVATFTFTVPAGLELGQHSVTALGLTSGTTSTVTFTVTADGSRALANTGVDAGPLLTVGALALGTGAALTAAGARRRRV